jgi:hypothetical protein
MGNRGFDIINTAELQESEKERANGYIERVYGYFLDWLFPFLREHLEGLSGLQSPAAALYGQYLNALSEIEAVLMNTEFRRIVREDPRHLFLMASSRRYPRVFYGYQGSDLDVPGAWQQMACSMLKMAHLIKSVEEDSQDINDYAQLGFFLEAQGQSLDDLYQYDWDSPKHIPDNEPAKRAFVKVSTFFHKLKPTMTTFPNQSDSRSAPCEAATQSTMTSRTDVVIGVPSKYFTLPLPSENVIDMFLSCNYYR